MHASAPWLVLLMLLAGMMVAPPVGAQEALREAQVSAGDLTVTWQVQRGLGIQYRGIDVFEPYASEFTVHDAKWTTAFFSSRSGNPTATLAHDGETTSLQISDKSEVFSYTKRVTVSPDNRVVVEYEFGQMGLQDAHLQLGWRPAVTCPAMAA